MATVAMVMEPQTKTITAQEKWGTTDTFGRQRMLSQIGYSSSFATNSWSKLPYMLKENLKMRTWTA